MKLAASSNGPYRLASDTKSASAAAPRRVYTPGKFGWAQPNPQLTMPTSTQGVVDGPATTSGPPLSPSHESLPPANGPAQSMEARSNDCVPPGAVPWNWCSQV